MQLTREQHQVREEYTQYLAVQYRRTDNARTVLKAYFAYLNTCELSYLSVRIREAQEFQHYLSTHSSSDGTPHYSTGTVSTMMTVLTSFYEYLKVRNHVCSNPFKEIQKIKQHRILPGNILSEEQLASLLKSIRNFLQGKDLIERRNMYKAHVLAEVMYSTGARIHEVVNLKVEDIDFVRGTVHIRDTKTNQERECLLNSFAQEILYIYVMEMREHVLHTGKSVNSELLFGSAKNIRLTFNRILGTECKKLKLGTITSHGIRHAVGVHLLKAGCDIRFIQDILGHKDLSSTQLYTHVEKEDLKSILDTYHPRVFKKGATGEAC